MRRFFQNVLLNDFSVARNRRLLELGFLLGIAFGSTIGIGLLF